MNTFERYLVHFGAIGGIVFISAITLFALDGDGFNSCICRMVNNGCDD